MTTDILWRIVIAAGLTLLGFGLYWAWNRWHLRRLRRQASIPGLERLRVGIPAILYFTTPDCLACRAAQRPALDRLKSELGEGLQIVEVDAAAHPAIADYWGVLSVPTTFVVDATGQPRRVNHGVAGTTKLRQQVEEVEETGKTAAAYEQATRAGDERARIASDPAAPHGAD